VALTFDDGTDDFFNIAWPEVRGRGWGATAFVVTGRVGADADWDGPKGAQLMDWEQLRSLRAEGAEVGAHAHLHRALDLLTPDEVRADLAAAYAALSREAGRPEGVAYPYGRGGRAVAQAAAAAGFAWGATARGGRSRRDGPRYLLRRTQVRGDDGPLRLWIKVATGYARWVEWRMDVRRMKDEG
jgi:peptidoglycan/xylan/chitin deacetylase (PgdA/CDA1 family)